MRTTVKALIITAALMLAAVTGAGVAGEQEQQETGAVYIHVLAGGVPIVGDIKVHPEGTQKFAWITEHKQEADAAKFVLPVGVYDFRVASPGLGGAAKVFQSIEVTDGATLHKTANFEAPGTLTISAAWTGRPLWKQKLRYYWKHGINLGGLMGGSYTPPPGGIAIHYKIMKDTGEKLFETLSVGLPAPISIPMKPGRYTLLAAPGYWELPDKAIPVEIIAGQEVVKSYTFAWPDKD